MVSMDCGGVTNIRISLIKTNGKWYRNKGFVSSVSRVVTMQETAPRLSSSARWMDAKRITTHYCTPFLQTPALQMIVKAKN